MIPIDLFLVHYGRTDSFMNAFNFAQRHKNQLLEVMRLDKFERGGYAEQILGDHIFYLIFADSKSLCRFSVLGCRAKSGYSGSGPACFKDMMDWLEANDVDIAYYSVQSYEEVFQLWGSEQDEHGQRVPSAKGAHREYGPSPWDYGDKFIQHSNSMFIEEYEGLAEASPAAKQKLYSNTLEFLIERLGSGDILRAL